MIAKETNPEAQAYTKIFGSVMPSSHKAIRLKGKVRLNFTVRGANQRLNRDEANSTKYPEAKPAMSIEIKMSIRTSYDETPEYSKTCTVS